MDLSPDDKDFIDDMLCRVDDDRIAAGLPILSVLVRCDDGAVSGAFWSSVRKHNLRRIGETDKELIHRLTESAFARPE
jgi:UTP:GlnB (protein PII) uridylyltransferase